MTNFEYAGHRIRGRMVLRVVPNDPIEVKIITGDQTFTFNMADICVEGIGVTAHLPLGILNATTPSK